MAYGTLVTNAANHVLISSEMQTLHCAGRATYNGLAIAGGLTDFPDYSGDSFGTLSGRWIHQYYIYTGGATPVFFIKPASLDFHGILRQWQSGAYWYVDILQGGLYSYPPTVLAFVTPDVLSTVGTGNYGLRTQLPDGRTAFDSRLKPLHIRAAISAIPPTVPCDGGTPTRSGGYAWNDSTLDFNFRCNNTFNYYPIPDTGLYYSRMMFSAPCIAQAVYSRIKDGFKTSDDSYGKTQFHYSTAIWWAMYHSCYRIYPSSLWSSGYLHAGWGTYAAGYKFYSSYTSDTWFFGLFGSPAGSYSIGVAPYADKTINLQPNTVIISDATPYL